MENVFENRWKLISASMIAAAVLLFLFLIWPLVSGGFQNMQKSEALQSRIDRGAEWEITIGRIDEEKKEIRSFFSQVASNSPGNKNMSNTLEILFEISGETAVTIQQIRPAEAIINETYREIPIEIRFTGSYHNIAHMMNQIEHLGYWLKPNQILIRTDKDNPNILEGELMLSVFYMNFLQTD